MEEKVITGIYIRVSTEDQARDGFSINAQKEKLTKYAEANDWSIFDYYIEYFEMKKKAFEDMNFDMKNLDQDK